MRTLGLLGGMAWPSTLEAYRQLNEEVARRLGGSHSARLVLWSADFAEIEAMQTDGRWDEAGRLLADAAVGLVRAGAEGLFLCTNTMHRVADAITAAVDVPLLHIADATAERARADGVSTVGLLGTRFTMEQDFYRERLVAVGGVDAIVPEEGARAEVHRIIFDELVHGIVDDRSRAYYVEVAAELVARGAQAVVAGCTEIELLVRPDDLDVPLYPTTRLQVLAAVDWMLTTTNGEVAESADGRGRPAASEVGDDEAITVTQYRPEWVDRATDTIALLRALDVPGCVRVEHIGSTAIPGMAAKDLLDLQMSVRDLDVAAAALDRALPPLGFVRSRYVRDHVPAGRHDDPARWVKLLWRRRDHADGDVNLHVRLAGSPGERLALLFRDWLRAHPDAVAAYGAFKHALAAEIDDVATYSDIKDPVVDLVVAAAERWADDVGWQP